MNAKQWYQRRVAITAGDCEKMKREILIISLIYFIVGEYRCISATFKPIEYKFLNGPERLLNGKLVWTNETVFNTSGEYQNQLNNELLSFPRDGLYFISLNIGFQLPSDVAISVVHRTVEYYQEQVQYYERGYKVKSVTKERHIVNTVCSLSINSNQSYGISSVNFQNLFMFNSSLSYYVSISGTGFNCFSDSLSKLTSMVNIMYQSNVYFTGSYWGSSKNNLINIKKTSSSRISFWNSQMRFLEDGIYVLTITGYQKRGVDFELNIKYEKNKNFLLRRTASDSAAVTFSMSYILKRKRRDTIKFNLLFGDMGNSDNNVISIMKLKDSTKFPVLYLISTRAKINPAIRSTIPFNSIEIQVGNEWDKTESLLKIKEPGKYYVYVTIETRKRTKVDVSVMKNNESLFEILKFPIAKYNGDYVSNSAIVTLNIGDKLQVLSNKESSYGTEYNLTTLMVFFLS